MASVPCENLFRQPKARCSCSTPRQIFAPERARVSTLSRDYVGLSCAFSYCEPTLSFQYRADSRAERRYAVQAARSRVFRKSHSLRRARHLDLGLPSP